MSLPRLFLTTLLRRLIWNYHVLEGEFGASFDDLACRTGGFGNAVLDETNTLQLKDRVGGLANKVEEAHTLQPDAPLILIGQLRGIRTLSKDDSGYRHLSVFFVKCDSDASG